MPGWLFLWMTSALTQLKMMFTLEENEVQRCEEACGERKHLCSEMEFRSTQCGKQGVMLKHCQSLLTLGVVTF